VGRLARLTRSAGLGQPGEALADRAGPAVADALDLHELLDRRGQQVLQRAEVLDQPVDDDARQARDAGEEPVAAGADRALQRVPDDGEAQAARHRGEVDEVGGGQLRQALQDVLDRSRVAAGADVVADDQLPVVADPAGQLLQLEGDEAAVGAQLDGVLLDLGADPAHHLQALEHRGDVPDGHQVLDLQGGEGAGDLVEAGLVALQRLQGLVGAGQDLAGVLQHVAQVADVDGDHRHRLAHRHHRVAGLLGHPLRGAVPGAALPGLDAGVGDQLGGRPEDPGALPVQDDGAVHLGQLPQPRGRELHVQLEAAGAQRLDHLVEAHDDEGAGAAAQDALQAVPQLRAGSDGSQGGPQQLIVLAFCHRCSVPDRCLRGPWSQAPGRNGSPAGPLLRRIVATARVPQARGGRVVTRT
jgi:hypothetical protein